MVHTTRTVGTAAEQLSTSPLFFKLLGITDHDVSIKTFKNSIYYIYILFNIIKDHDLLYSIIISIDLN